MVPRLRRKDLGERIEGVPDGSIALDEETNELIVDGEARLREYNGAVIDLPDEPLTFEQE